MQSQCKDKAVSRPPYLYNIIQKYLQNGLWNETISSFATVLPGCRLGTGPGSSCSSSSANRKDSLKTLVQANNKDHHKSFAFCCEGNPKKVQYCTKPNNVESTSLTPNTAPEPFCCWNRNIHGLLSQYYDHWALVTRSNHGSEWTSVLVFHKEGFQLPLPFQF